jgi:hypothetical protein
MLQLGIFKSREHSGWAIPLTHSASFQEGHTLYLFLPDSDSLPHNFPHKSDCLSMETEEFCTRYAATDLSYAIPEKRYAEFMTRHLKAQEDS